MKELSLMTEPIDLIRDFVISYVKDDSLENDENMFELGYVNSLFAMQLVAFLETTFGFQVDRSELKLDNFKSIGAMAQLVARLKGAI
jgi:acyl carrier protein